MQSIDKPALAAALFLALPGCQPGESVDGSAVGDEAATEIRSGEGISQTGFAGITAGETIHLVGTEPFWGGTIGTGELVYTTPENQTGDRIAVKRFAGNNGLGFSGTLGGASLDLAVTPGACTDGMSDRSYPFTVTLRIGEDQRRGCAWTDRTPFTGPANP